MPQGTVIAVRPQSRKSDATLASFSSIKGGGEPDDRDMRRVYIEVYNSTEIVWFDAPKGAFRKRNVVRFDNEPNNKISLDGAKNVIKLRDQKDYLPKGLLTKVALLASLLLLGSVALESRTKR